MKHIWTHCRAYIFRGLIAAIPIGLSYFVVRFFYVAIDRKVINIVDQFIGYRIPGLGLVIVLISLYLTGYLASNVIGKRFFGFLERISDRIPLIKTTYQVGKQLSLTLSLPEKQVFKRVVLVDYFRPEVWAIGFVTGTLLGKEVGETLLKVFVPTVPNPTSGVLIILKESQVRDPHWSVEEGMRMVISGGIIGPDGIRKNNGPKELT